MDPDDRGSLRDRVRRRRRVDVELQRHRLARGVLGAPVGDVGRLHHLRCGEDRIAVPHGCGARRGDVRVVAAGGDDREGCDGDEDPASAHRPRYPRCVGRVGGGGGSRTPVFRVVGGTSPSAADGLVSDPHCPSAACADPDPAAMSRRATGPVPAVSCSIWRSGSGRAAGPGGTSLLIPKQRVRGCPRQVFLVPALLRRSDDVGSLLPPRSSKSKPRTPLSVPPRCVRRRRRQCRSRCPRTFPGSRPGRLSAR